MREMTGADILSRRASDFTIQHANPKLVKSRSNLELSSHGRSHPHRSDKGHDRPTHGGHKSHDKPTNHHASRRNSRIGHRGSDSLNKATRSKNKDAQASVENPDASKSAGSSSVLPPISGHQISIPSVKNGGVSPRNGESVAPTRMCIRNSSSSPEDLPGKSQDNQHPYSVPDGSPQTPSIVGSGIVRNGPSANIFNYGHAARMASPESPRIPDSSRLSPINNHDRPKVKFEKKVMKQLVDESVPSSPRAYKISSAELGSHQQPPPSRDSKTKQRRSSQKSLPKIVPTDEPFSVRRKIEQFRKWHEEHYADALKSSPAEEDFSQAAKCDDDEKPENRVDFAQILEDNIVEKRLSTTDGDATGEVTKQDINGNIVNKVKNVSMTNKEKKNVTSRARPKSGATWKTWRDVNQSDAYDDVKKYIQDNELMDDEREKWIRTWIRDVKTAMDNSPEVIVDE